MNGMNGKGDTMNGMNGSGQNEREQQDEKILVGKVVGRLPSNHR
jgi:hypothetical protein